MIELPDQKKYEILARLSLMALYLVFGIDMVLMVVAYFIQGKTITETMPDSAIIRNIFLALALAELGALHLIKKALLSRIPTITNTDEVPYRQLLSINYIVAGMCVSVSIYGFIIILLGGEFDLMLSFVAISLIAFQLFRLRKRDLDRIGIK